MTAGGKQKLRLQLIYYDHENIYTAYNRLNKNDEWSKIFNSEYGKDKLYLQSLDKLKFKIKRLIVQNKTKFPQN